MNNIINSIFEAKEVTKEEVRNRFRQLNNNGDIVASVTYNDGNFIVMDYFDKFEILDGILYASQPNVEDYPESIMILFEEHKCVSF